MGGPERLHQGGEPNLANLGLDKKALERLHITDFQFIGKKENLRTGDDENIKENILEYSAKLFSQPFHLKLIVRKGEIRVHNRTETVDEVEVQARRLSDQEVFSSVIETDESGGAFVVAFQRLYADIHAANVRIQATEALKRAELTAHLAQKDSNLAVMQELGMTNIEAVSRGENRFEYKVRIEGQDYQMILVVHNDKVEALAVRKADSIMFGKTLPKPAGQAIFHEVLMEVHEQVKREEEKTRSTAEQKKAKEDQEKEPTTAEEIADVLTNQLAPQVGLMLLSALHPISTNVTGREEERRGRLPSQELRARSAEQVHEAKEEAKKQTERLNSTLRQRASSEVQTDWSANYLLSPANCPAQDDITASLEKKGYKSVSIIYPPNNFRIYQFETGDRLVRFSILPGGVISYESDSVMATVANPIAGFIINIVDFKQGDFRANSLDDAIARLDTEALAPLLETRQFIYSPIPGIQPLDVTGMPALQSYALPYPVSANIPMRDYQIPMPFMATQSRGFLYRPIWEGASVPMETHRRWYEFGKQAEANLIDQQAEANGAKQK